MNPRVTLCNIQIGTVKIDFLRYPAPSPFLFSSCFNYKSKPRNNLFKIRNQPLNKMFFGLISALAVTTFLCFIWLKWKQQYWKRKEVHQFTPHLIFGDMGPVLTGSSSYKKFIIDIYKIAKSAGYKFVGLYATFSPQLMVIDVDLVKRVLAKDFHHFTSRGAVNHKSSELTHNIFSMEGAEWNDRRKTLSPLFSSGKMKIISGTVAENSNRLVNTVNKLIDQNQPLPCKDLCARFSTDVIASIAFGLECNSLNEPEHIFRRIGRQILTGHVVKMFLENFVAHSILTVINYQKYTREVRNYFPGIVKDAISYREKTNLTRRDFLQLMIDQKNSQSSNCLSDEDIVCESFTFFLAGFDTSSSTMTFALLELAQNQEIQDKLRKDIFSTLERHNGQISYDAIMEMEYLDRVVKETLRKHPVLFFLKRKCTKDYTIPDTKIQIEKGISVLIPVMGLHMDPEYYENPEEFNPDNFLSEKVAKRPDYAYLPFGEGPRICVGMRFGKMQTKMGLVSLLTNFKFTLHETMKPPFRSKVGAKMNMLEHEVLLEASRITKS